MPKEQQESGIYRTATLPILHSMQRQLRALRVLLEGGSEEEPRDEERPGLHGGGNDQRLGGRSGSTVMDRLTPREREVLELLIKGASNHGIARSLGISVRTVKAHLGSIFGKLDVGGRAEAIVRVLSEEYGREAAQPEGSDLPEAANH